MVNIIKQIKSTHLFN